MDDALRNRLHRLKLEQYVEVLEVNGYLSWNQLKMVTEKELRYLGFKLGHRRVLQREIASAKDYPLSEALPWHE